ncbi:divalent-cation tolerance protein CutA [Niveispirillum lacus]|uniref:Divalent-cation tolerance protein CutA n=1 Tax=Niveispirillum lacus TaxID=1981099 RepID=A0A255YYL8_9PROT|nr:divalent-cation tolerance protein CutA [Niveispirillum lacus]OYQ34337.1 divalent-cation tolerance protein CutA [Niveispirillum lacus]
MSAEISLVYVTTPDSDLARTIAADVVTAGLAACANIITGMESVYRWQGKVESATETVLILKTRSDGVAALSARVRALHPYEVPCILALPVTSGLPDYLAWLAAESAGQTISAR